MAGQIARQAGADPVDYDADNDNLIEISALAQLDAVRYDLDGNGLGVVGDDAVAYAAAFPGLPKGMGCAAVCAGYELAADLDFDTDGDGQTYTISGGTVTVDAGDTGNFFDSAEGWIPIGNNATGYSGVFEGNRHIIDHLFINVPNNSANDVARERVGLFAKVDRGGVIRGVSLTDVYMNRERTGTGIVYAGALVGQSFGTVTASSATGEVRAIDAYASSSSQVGGLVGESGNRSAVNASWADVVVTVDGPMVRAGGLVGASLAGKIVASHAYGAVNVDDSPNGRIGGLVGSLNLLGAVPATVTASYARGEVAGSGTSTTGRVLGGLVGGGSSASGVTDSYWDNSSSGTNQVSSYGGGEGKTTAELQTPVGYTGIYENWNVNVDGATGNDDPWHFGTANQYPTLKYGGFSPAAQGSAGADYDTDSDGLIEITTLAQLDAIRHDLDGNGRPTSVLAYRCPAFPLGDVGSDAEMGATGRMGCAYDDDNDPATDPALTCLGYELMGDLDFDTDGDGSTHTAGVGDPGDDYYNGGAGWSPHRRPRRNHASGVHRHPGRQRQRHRKPVPQPGNRRRQRRHLCGPLRRPHRHGAQCGPDAALCQKRAQRHGHSRIHPHRSAGRAQQRRRPGARQLCDRRQGHRRPERRNGQSPQFCRLPAGLQRRHGPRQPRRLRRHRHGDGGLPDL